MSASERKIAELEGEVRKLKHLLAKQLHGNYSMTMESGVSSDTNEPFVTCRWGDEVGQLTPAQVREHAIKLVECAAAAEFDAVLVKTLMDPPDPDMPKATYEHAIVFLGLMREARGAPGDGSAKAVMSE